ncbi:hypothetical protein A9K56_03975 [Stenotrophomonas maltophilia]|uniref:Uncharacterized protein n=1 Tax=Stenotrophomonas maltophilia TaxID=40324 RepID=A0AAP7GUP9_STEMA|nr:hypothetical protein A9K56_03975 [Stenotrophomonas maltophilia]
MATTQLFMLMRFIMGGLGRLLGARTWLGSRQRALEKASLSGIDLRLAQDRYGGCVVKPNIGQRWMFYFYDPLV